MSNELEDTIEVKIPGTQKKRTLRETFEQIDRDAAEAKENVKCGIATLNGEHKWAIFTESETDDECVE